MKSATVPNEMRIYFPCFMYPLHYIVWRENYVHFALCCRELYACLWWT